MPSSPSPTTTTTPTAAAPRGTKRSSLAAPTASCGRAAPGPAKSPTSSASQSTWKVLASSASATPAIATSFAQTTHVDVLSYYAIRNDWDPAHPASGIRNLEAGRYRVLDEYRKRGIDVSSEALRYPMIGHISSFWYAQCSGRVSLWRRRHPASPGHLSQQRHLGLLRRLTR